MNDYMNDYAKWFRRVVWLGILANLALALPTLFLPDEMLAMFSLPSASPSMWPSFAALLLILLSLFYIPATRPLEYRPVAWLAVLARLAGVIFFCVFNRDYIAFGLLDLTFFIPESILLTLAIKQAEKTIRGGAAGRNIADATPGTNMPPPGAGVNRGGAAPGSDRRCYVVSDQAPGLTYYEIFPYCAAPYFALRGGALSLWFDRDRRDGGSAVLDLAGAATGIPG